MPAFEPETIEFLESGCALIVGVVAPDGTPWGDRAWGLRVTDPENGGLRVLVAAAETTTLAYMADPGVIAVTGCDVRTLRSMQCKGVVRSTETATADDLETVAAFCEHFFRDVHETDGVEIHLLERMVPPAFAACSITVHEFFDQTPGPAAGTPIAGETV